MHLHVRQPPFFPLLIGKDKKAGAHTHMQKTSGNKKRRRFHLRCQTSHPKPCLPFLRELITYRHNLRLMLSEKGILALYNADMMTYPAFFCCLYQCSSHCKIRASRIFDRCILAACPLHPDRSVCNHQISAKYIFLHSAAGAYTQKRVCTAFGKLLDGNRSRRSADSGGSHTHPDAI